MFTLKIRNIGGIVSQAELIYSTEVIVTVVRINHPKEIVRVKSDSKLCNLTASLEASLIYILTVKLSDIFFHYYMLNRIKICGKYRRCYDYSSGYCFTIGDPLHDSQNE